LYKTKYINSPNLSLAFLFGVLGEVFYFIGDLNGALSVLIMLRVPLVILGLIFGIYELKFLKKLNKNKLIVSLGLFMCIFSILEISIKIINNQPL
jgi:hypothetical protein